MRHALVLVPAHIDSIMNKRRRLDSPGSTVKSHSSNRDLVSLLESAQDGSTPRPGAFSPTANLIALAAARSTSPDAAPRDALFPSSNDLAHLPEPLAINLTYLSGSNPASASIPRLHLRLEVPHSSSFPSDPNAAPSVSSAAHRIKLLSFSPDGAYLLCASGSDRAETDGSDDYLTVFEHADSGCIDQWSMILHEQAGRFGARTGGTSPLVATDGKEVISVRWIGEPRPWYLDPDYVPAEADQAQAGSPGKPFVCAPPRSSPLSGAAFVAVLSSAEIVFVHLPRTSPLLPNIVCMPLHPPPSALVSPSSVAAALPEVTALSPSRRALSLTAVPTPPTSLARSIGQILPTVPGSQPLGSSLPGPAAVDQATPTSHISQLVGSLVSTLPSMDASLPLPIAPSPAAGAGNAALKEELRAAELAHSIESDNPNGSNRRRRVHKADVGAVRGTRASSEAGITTFLIATVSRRSRSRPRRAAPAPPTEAVPAAPVVPPLADAATLAADLGINMNLDEENFDLASIDGFDFGSLDAAFGSSTTTEPAKPAPVPPSPDKKPDSELEKDRVESKDWDDWASENAERQDAADADARDQWKIELSEVNIDMLNVDGPRLTVKPQPHLFAAPPTFVPINDDESEVVQTAKISTLAFLEDSAFGVSDSQPGSESAVDLQLLVVATALDSRPRTFLSSYALSNEPYPLSEAFAHLECKKADLSSVDLGEWSARLAIETPLPNAAVMTCLTPRVTGRSLCPSFFAVLAEPTALTATSQETKDAGWKSQVVVLSSDTLLPVESIDAVTLPSPNLYSSLLSSPNAAVVVALPHESSTSFSRPVIAASPFSRDCSSQLALSLIRQADATDVVGVAVTTRSDADSLLELLESTHSIVQAQLPASQLVSNTSIQFDLLGIASGLFASSKTLSSAVRIRAAQGTIELASAVRAFTKVEKRQRGASGLESYRCEIDALWPLVGHATWYCQFLEKLIRDTLRSSTDPPSPLLLHLLHPVPRALHQRLCVTLLGLCSTLKTLSTTPEPGMSLVEQEMIDLAGKIVDDAIHGDDESRVGGLSKWKDLLDKVEAIEGLTSGVLPGSSLSTLTIPQNVYPQANQISSLLSQAYPNLAPTAKDSLPSPPKSPPPSSSSNALERDLIRKCQLPLPTLLENTKTQVMTKQCLRCGKKSGAVSATLSNGVWAGFEAGWRSKCACGGLWRTV
ncbi:uncharacterized protein JCM15063_000848 [Sporobolomyces koalae]|uniref:uncharacterized protein n=1 Tax=Sporobolomyces koalae TaxID=500713 RepID=UPI00317114F1